MNIRRGASASIAVEAPAGAATPQSGKLLVAVGGTRAEFPLDAGDGAWRALLTPAQTTALAVGAAMAEAQFAFEDGGVAIVPVDGIVVLATLSADSALTDAPQTVDEQVLAAAETALLSAADTAAVAFSAGDQSFSFESRGELLSFVERLRRQVRPRRQLVTS